MRMMMAARRTATAERTEVKCQVSRVYERRASARRRSPTFTPQTAFCWLVVYCCVSLGHPAVCQTIREVTQWLTDWLFINKRLATWGHSAKDYLDCGSWWFEILLHSSFFLIILNVRIYFRDPPHTKSSGTVCFTALLLCIVVPHYLMCIQIKTCEVTLSASAGKEIRTEMDWETNKEMLHLHEIKK